MKTYNEILDALRGKPSAMDCVMGQMLYLAMGDDDREGFFPWLFDEYGLLPTLRVLKLLELNPYDVLMSEDLVDEWERSVHWSKVCYWQLVGSIEEIYVRERFGEESFAFDTDYYDVSGKVSTNQSGIIFVDSIIIRDKRDEKNMPVDSNSGKLLGGIIAQAIHIIDYN